MGRRPLDFHIALIGHILVWLRSVGHTVACLELYAVTCGVLRGCS